MSRSKHVDRGSGTAVGGTLSSPVFRYHSDGETTTIRVEPTIATTSYDVLLADKDGDIIYQKNNNVGTLIDRTRVDVISDMTISILNSSLPTETFNWKVIIDELV